MKSSWLKSSWLKGPGLKLGIEKSRVEMTLNPKAKVLLSNSYTVSLGFLALATYFFERLIAMSMLMMAKKRRKRELYSSQILQFLHETLNEGKSTL